MLQHLGISERRCRHQLRRLIHLCFDLFLGHGGRIGGPGIRRNHTFRLCSRFFEQPDQIGIAVQSCRSQGGCTIGIADIGIGASGKQRPDNVHISLERRQHQRCQTDFGRRVYLGTVSEQRVDETGVSAHARDEQCGRTGGIWYVWIGSFSEQHRRDFLATTDDRTDQGRHAGTSLNIGIRAVVQKRVDHTNMSSDRGIDQGWKPAAVDLVGIRAGFQQRPHDLAMAAGDRLTQDRIVFVVPGTSIGTMLQKLYRNGRMTVVRGERQRRPTVVGAGVYRGAAGQEHFNDFRVALRDRRHQCRVAGLRLAVHGRPLVQQRDHRRHVAPCDRRDERHRVFLRTNWCWS